MKIHHYTFKNHIFLSFFTKMSGNFRGNSNAPDLGIKNSWYTLKAISFGPRNTAAGTHRNLRAKKLDVSLEKMRGSLLCNLKCFWVCSMETASSTTTILIFFNFKLVRSAWATTAFRDEAIFLMLILKQFWIVPPTSSAMRGKMLLHNTAK